VAETLDWLCANGPVDDPSGRLQMRSVGSTPTAPLGSRGAALLADYADAPGNAGLLFVPDATLQEQMRRVMSCGLQVAVHAIGDRANRQVLDAYARLLPEFPRNPGRHRIEHVQVLDPADLPRFAALGIIAAMQPTHATSDMYWAGERLGEERLAGAYAWKSLADSGALLAFGSDFPVEQANPMLGIYAAVSRQDLAGWPEGGWQPQEIVTRAQAICAFTRTPRARRSWRTRSASLETGKRADFIVLDRDPMQVPVEELPAVQVLQTWVDGQRVFQRPMQ
jgi:predicted amidohydrolase YtcJ